MAVVAITDCYLCLTCDGGWPLVGGVMGPHKNPATGQQCEAVGQPVAQDLRFVEPADGTMPRPLRQLRSNHNAGTAPRSVEDTHW